MDKQHQLMLIRGLKSGSLNKNQQLQAIRALKSNVDNNEVSNLVTSLSFTNLNTGKDLNKISSILEPVKQKVDIETILSK